MRGYVDPADVSTDTIQVLRPDGTIAEDHGYSLDLKDEDLRAMYRVMTITRLVDAESTNLQRQGELGVYTPSLGQEGAQIGVGYALEPDDWIFPSYRELGLAMLRNIDPGAIMHLFRGTVHGGMWDFREHRFAPYSVPIATQCLHATGFATGAKLDGQKLVAMACFGDGATSEGDFHEGCNYAGAWKAPVVFFCQNNQYAISVPLAKQTAAPTLHIRALGYGMPGWRVDGNDVLACYVVGREAIAHARAGNGPAFIEAVTYRRGPHSTADDPKRYRSDEELAEWEALDPIARFKTYLRAEGVLTDEHEAEYEAEGKARATELRASIVGAGPLEPTFMFDHVYEEMPPTLARQRAAFVRDREAE